jgi:hypothetical protein
LTQSQHVTLTAVAAVATKKDMSTAKYVYYKIKSISHLNEFAPIRTYTIEWALVWAMEFPALLSLVYILPLDGSTVFCTQIKKRILAGSYIHQQNSTQSVTQRLENSFIQ